MENTFVYIFWLTALGIAIGLYVAQRRKRITEQSANEEINVGEANAFSPTASTDLD